MPMEYDQLPTRVYQRPGVATESGREPGDEPERSAAQPRTADRRDERIGYTQPLAKPGGVLDGISVAQVIAGAAAAATSMLLASKIGIAGSVIGAAVSSAVTIVCSQLYRRALDASAEKLRARQSHPEDYASAASRYGASDTARPDGDAAPLSAPDGARPARGARIAPTKLQARAAAERSATQRKVILASAALAAAAVAACALAILASTGGEGLGAKPAGFLDQQPGVTSTSPDAPAVSDNATADDVAASTPTPEDAPNAEADAPQQPSTPETSDNAANGGVNTSGNASGGSAAPQPNAPDQPTTPAKPTPDDQPAEPNAPQTPEGTETAPQGDGTTTAPSATKNAA